MSKTKSVMAWGFRHKATGDILPGAKPTKPKKVWFMVKVIRVRITEVKQ